MYVKIKEKQSNLFVDAEILVASIKDMPLKKDGWLFNWREIFRKNKNSDYYKIVLKNQPEIVQAIAVFSLTSYGLFYMDQVETSPENRGCNGKYEAVASLISFGCKLSFNIKEPYRGFLGFTSKTNLIKVYQNKYKAKVIRLVASNKI